MNRKLKVLVTGANGLLGTNTIIELLSQGYYVKGFLRDKNSFVGGNHKYLELFEGDILNNSDLNKAMLNCNYVVHTAGVTFQKFLKYNDYEKVNVQGTINVMEAALQNKLKKFIYVSTSNVFGFGSLNSLGDESIPMKLPFSKSLYAKSKQKAQNYVMAKRNHIDVVIVNPTFMIGAFDNKLSSGKIILMALKQHILLCPPGGKNFVCVKDVSNGIIHAINYGVNGEAYLLANQNLTFKAFFRIVKKQTKAKFIMLQLPKCMLMLLGYLGNCAIYFGLKTHFSVENMKCLCINNYYSNSKAAVELKMVFNPIENGITDAAEWFENSNKF